MIGHRSLIALLSLLGLLLAVAAPARADRIDDYIKAEMQKRRIPGLALAVVRNGAVVKMQGYGLTNLDHDVPNVPRGRNEYVRCMTMSG